MRKTLYLTGSLLLAVLLLAPIGAEALTLSRTLYRGMPQDSVSKSEVSQLQDFLTSSNYLAQLSEAVKGYFGVITEEAVQRFQDAYSLVPSRVSRDGYGIVGPATRAKIAEVTSNAVSYGESSSMPNYGSDMAALGAVANTNQITSTLSLGSRGAEVVILQNFLKQRKHYPAGCVFTSGQFDPCTKKALQAFQNASGLMTNQEAGIVGPLTKAKINQALLGSLPTIITPVLAQPSAPIRSTISLSWTPIQSGVNYEIWRRGGSRTVITTNDVLVARQRGNVACGAEANNQSLCVIDGAGDITGNSYMDSQSKNNGEYTYSIVARRSGSENKLSNSVFVKVGSASSLTVLPENKGRSAIAGRQDALLTRFTLKAGKEGGISVSRLTFSKTGNLSASRLSKCLLKDGKAALNSDSRIVKPSDTDIFGVFDLDKPIFISAGESKTLELTCNVDSAGPFVQTLTISLESVAPTASTIPSLPISMGMLSVVTENDNIRTDAEMDINNNDDLNVGDNQIIVNVINSATKCPTGKNCDMNGDGQVSDIDSDLLINRLLGRINPAKVATSRPSPDLNGDGWVDAKDTLIIANYIASRPNALLGTFCIPESECDVNLLGKVSAYDKAFIASYYSMSPFGILRSPDIDRNGVVNQADIQYVASQMSGTQIMCVADKCNLNNDSDGLVNSDDLSIVKNYLLGEMSAPYVKNGLSHDPDANKLRWSIESDKDLVRFDILRSDKKLVNPWNVAQSMQPKWCKDGAPWIDCTKGATMDRREMDLSQFENNQDYYYWIAIVRSENIQGLISDPKPVVLGPVKVKGIGTEILTDVYPSVSSPKVAFNSGNIYPQISWKYVHNGSQPQSGYEIEIADTKEGLNETKTRAVVGEGAATVVNLNAQNLLLRGRDPLRNGQKYFYQVSSVFKNGTTFTTVKSPIESFVVPSLYSDLKVYTVPQELMVTLQWNRTVETDFVLFKVNGPDDFETWKGNTGNKFQSVWICENGTQRGPAEGCSDGRPQWSRYAFKGVAGVSYYQIGARDVATDKIYSLSPIVKVEFPSIVTPAVKIDSLSGPDYSWKVGDAKKVSWNLKYQEGVLPSSDEKRKVSVSLVEVTTGVGDKSNSVNEIVRSLADYDTDNMQLTETGEIKIAMPPVDFKANAKYALLVTSKLEGRDTPAGADFSVPFRVVTSSPYTPLKFVESSVDKVTGTYAVISAKFSGSAGDLGATSAYITHGVVDAGGLVATVNRDGHAFEIKSSGNTRMDVWPLQPSKTYRYYVYANVDAPESNGALVPARIRSNMMTFVTSGATANHSPSEIVAHNMPSGDLEKGKLYDFEWRSGDPDGDPLLYSWTKRFSGVESGNGGTGPSPCLLNDNCADVTNGLGTSMSFDTVGTWTIEVSADDLRGGKVTKTYTFNVVEASGPSVSFTSPTEGATLAPNTNTTVTFDTTGIKANGSRYVYFKYKKKKSTQSGWIDVKSIYGKTSTLSYVWKTPAIVGEYKLKADLIDASKGANSIATKEIQITVGNVTTAPAESFVMSATPDNPIGRILIGDNGVEWHTVAQYSLRADNGALTVASTTFNNVINVANVTATPNNEVSSVIREFGAFDSNGVRVDDFMAPSNGKLVNGKVTFSFVNGKLVIPKNDSKSITIKVKLNSVTSAEKTGKLLRLVLDSSNMYPSRNGVSVYGANGALTGSAITASRWPDGTLRATSTASEFFAVRRTVPTITTVAPIETEKYLREGVSQVVYKFTVSANSNEDISWKGIKLDVRGRLSGLPLNRTTEKEGGYLVGPANNTNGLTTDVCINSAITRYVRNFRLYDDTTGQEVQQQNYKVEVDWNQARGVGEVAFILNDQREEVISAGTSKTYKVLADVAGTGMNSELNVTWRSEADGRRAQYDLVSGESPDLVDGSRDNAIRMTSSAPNGISYSFLWSDNSGARHSAVVWSTDREQKDWTNDRFLGDSGNSWNRVDSGEGGTATCSAVDPSTLTSVKLEGPSSVLKGNSATFVVSEKLPTTYAGGVTLKIVKSSDNSVVFTSSPNQNAVASFSWTAGTSVQEGAYKVQVWSTATPAVKVAEKDLTVTGSMVGPSAPPDEDNAETMTRPVVVAPSSVTRGQTVTVTIARDASAGLGGTGQLDADAYFVTSGNRFGFSRVTNNTLSMIVGSSMPAGKYGIAVYDSTHKLLYSSSLGSSGFTVTANETSAQASAPQQQQVLAAQAATPEQRVTATALPVPVAPLALAESQLQTPVAPLKGCSSYAGKTVSGMNFKQPATGSGGDSRIFCYDGTWHLSPSPKGLTSAGKSAEWSYFTPQVVDKVCTQVGDRYLSLMNPVSKYSYYNKGDRPADCGNTSTAPAVSPYAVTDKESQLASAIEALRLVLEQYMALQGR